MYFSLAAAGRRLRALRGIVTGSTRLLSTLALSAGTLVLVFDLPILDIAAALDLAGVGAVAVPRALLLLAAAAVVGIGVRWWWRVRGAARDSVGR